MGNIGENQGTSRKIKRFFPDVNVLPSAFDALKRLGKKDGLERSARRGERGGPFRIIGRRKKRGRRRIGKEGEIEKTVRRTNGLSKSKREPLDAEIAKKTASTSGF
jgi:hypothetical protein